MNWQIVSQEHTNGQMYVRTLYRVVQSSMTRYITLSTVNSTPHHIEINYTTLCYTICYTNPLTTHQHTPHHTTPHHTTLHYPTQHHTTQHNTTLHHTTPHQSSPNLRLCQCRSIIRYKRIFNIKSKQRWLQRYQIQVLIVHFRHARYWIAQLQVTCKLF